MASDYEDVPLDVYVDTQFHVVGAEDRGLSEDEGRRIRNAFKPWVRAYKAWADQLPQDHSRHGRLPSGYDSPEDSQSESEPMCNSKGKGKGISNRVLSESKSFTTAGDLLRQAPKQPSSESTLQKPAVSVPTTNSKSGLSGAMHTVRGPTMPRLSQPGQKRRLSESPDITYPISQHSDVRPTKRSEPTGQRVHSEITAIQYELPFADEALLDQLFEADDHLSSSDSSGSHSPSGIGLSPPSGVVSSPQQSGDSQSENEVSEDDGEIPDTASV